MDELEIKGELASSISVNVCKKIPKCLNKARSKAYSELSTAVLRTALEMADAHVSTLAPVLQGQATHAQSHPLPVRPRPSIHAHTRQPRSPPFV